MRTAMRRPFSDFPIVLKLSDQPAGSPSRRSASIQGDVARNATMSGISRTTARDHYSKVALLFTRDTGGEGVCTAYIVPHRVNKVRVDT